ncbi:MAG: hypothetical protein KAY22_23520 [Rhizorhabdus sp.]|uniref:hypothetical protein n=1 Tax=Rhizorhabdus sp. TaxID=1968843 RepID=UPI001B4AEFC4|nr:hypothetical protein [Rhizorhabdus sp.]MBP8235270.1 hypothetical protein [Rhizorhabdus sp.]
MSVHQLVEARNAARSVGLVYIAERAKLAPHLTVGSIVRKIRKWVEAADFPPPVTPRIYQGVEQTGAMAVHAHARWDRDHVDAWFDRRLPPKLRIVEDNALQRHAAATLDSRAAAMFGGAR